MQSNKNKNLIFAAMFAAIITVSTAYFHINIGANSGYVHFGDSMIYLAACLLPAPYAICAASAGGALADLLSGSAIWILPTAVIKALNVIPFVLMYRFTKHNKSGKIITGYTVAMSVLSGVITAVGYFIAEGIIFSFRSAAATFLLSLIQPIGSVIIFYAVGTALDTVKFKSRILN